MTTSTTLTRPPSTANPETGRASSVLVIELDDVVDRRHPDLPNLFVGVTVESHDAKIERIGRGARPRWARNHVVRLRPDLYERFEPTSPDEARAQKSFLVAELSRRGYTVNKETTGTWHVYVVQLDEKEVSDSGEGWVYVGESSLSPEDRLAQHLSGARNRRGPLFSRIVNRHGQHLRRDLMRGLPALYSQADSKLAEAELAEHLRDQGYKVEGGH